MSWRSWGRFRRYAAATLTVAAATAGSLFVRSVAVDDTQFPAYLIAVACSSLFLGLGPGLYATVLSVAIIDFVFLGPPLALTLELLPDDLERLAQFSFVAILTNWLTRARLRAEARLMAERRAHEAGLERTIAERTAELRDSNAALLQANERLSAVIEASPLPIAAVDARGRVALWNLAAERLFGWRADEAMGRRTPLIPPDRATEHEGIYAHTIAGEPVRGLETRRLRKDGTELDVRIWSAVSQSGVVLEIFEDNAERLRIAESLERARAAAEEANRAKSAFLANMSHEIRTPLGAVVGFADMLQTEGVPAAEQRQFLEIIQRNGRLLSDLINDLLDLSKIEAGEMTLESMPTSVPEILREVATTLSIRARDKGLALTVDVAEGFPPSVVSDPTRLRQIFLNLIGNAVKFTEQGRIGVAARYARVPGDEGTYRIAVSIRDSGIGIDPDRAQRLFNPFTQADHSVARRFGGTGLGLYLARRLAVALGGDVVLSWTEPGRGSEFTVALTVRAHDASQPAWRSRRDDAPARDQATDFGGAHVLLVDDAKDTRELLAYVLAQLHAEVDVAVDGDEGVTKALEGDYDVVLMDLRMPRVSGWEATARLRSGGYHRPIVAISADAMKGERERCLEAGFDEYVAKPFSRDQLLAAVRAARGGRGQTRHIPAAT